MSIHRVILTDDTVDVGDFAGLVCAKMTSLSATELKSICKTYISNYSSSGIAAGDCDGKTDALVEKLVPVCNEQASKAADKALEKMEAKMGKKVEPLKAKALKASKTRLSGRLAGPYVGAACAAAPVVVGVTDIFLQNACPASAPPVSLYMGCTSDFSNPWLNQGLDAWEKYYNYGSELPGTFLVFTKILALEAQKRVKNNDPFWKVLAPYQDDLDLLWAAVVSGMGCSEPGCLQGILDVAIDQPDIKTKISQFKLYKKDPTDVCDYVLSVGFDQDLLFQQIVTASKKAYNVQLTFFSNLTRAQFDPLFAQADKVCSSKDAYLTWSQQSDSFSTPYRTTQCVSYIMASSAKSADTPALSAASKHSFWPSSFPVMGAVILHFAVHML